MSADKQPVSHVDWVDPKTLHANDYNPNHVPPAELRLLALSIIENGWTQPLVALEDGTIVDGFHRWNLGVSNGEVRALTGGLVPVVRIRVDPATQRMATIRHNRARGNHHVVKMAAIVADLRGMGVSDAEIARRLGMDDEEVERLMDRGSMVKRGPVGDGFNAGWKTGIAEPVET